MNAAFNKHEIRGEDLSVLPSMNSRMPTYIGHSSKGIHQTPPHVIGDKELKITIDAYIFLVYILGYEDNDHKTIRRAHRPRSTVHPATVRAGSDTGSVQGAWIRARQLADPGGVKARGTSTRSTDRMAEG